MKIVILTQYYPPEPIPKPHELARGLTERGHEVLVITAFPNYPAMKLYPDTFRLSRILVSRIIRGTSHPASDVCRILGNPVVVVTVVNPGFAGPWHALGAPDRSPGFRLKDGLVQAGEHNHQVTPVRHFPAFREFQKPGMPMEMGGRLSCLASLTLPHFKNSRNSEYA